MTPVFTQEHETMICARFAETSITKYNFYKGSFACTGITIAPCQLMLDHWYLRTANVMLASFPVS